MSALDKLINDYLNETKLDVDIQLTEAGEMTDPMTAGAMPPALPAPGAAPQLGGTQVADPTQQPEEDDEEEGFEGESKHQRYINAIKDMRNLLSMDPDNIMSEFPKAFNVKIDDFRSAQKAHDIFRDIIATSPDSD